MVDPGTPAWWVRTPGTGRPLVPGDVVLVHARARHRPSDLDHDHDTRPFLDSLPDGPFEIPVDPAQLLPEVSAALMGQLVGATLVIHVSGTSHGLDDVAFYLEIQILDVRERAAEAVHRIATRRTRGRDTSHDAPLDPDTRQLIAAGPALGAVLANAHTQRNGFVITLPPGLEPAFRLLVAHVVSRHHDLPQPFRIEVRDHPTLSFLVSKEFLNAGKEALKVTDGAR